MRITHQHSDPSPLGLTALHPEILSLEALLYAVCLSPHHPGEDHPRVPEYLWTGAQIGQDLVGKVGQEQMGGLAEALTRIPEPDEDPVFQAVSTHIGPSGGDRHWLDIHGQDTFGPPGRRCKGQDPAAGAQIQGPPDPDSSEEGLQQEQGGPSRGMKPGTETDPGVEEEDL